jgi:hypothetical protein
LGDILMAEGNREVPFSDGKGETLMLPAKQAAIRRLLGDAVKGKIGSARLILTLTHQVEERLRDEQFELLKEADEYQRFWWEELERRKSGGEDLPDPVPHPDDIVLDWVAGTVTFKGPATAEQKAEKDRLHGDLLAMEAEILTLKEERRKSRKREVRMVIDADIAHLQMICDLIVERIGRPPKPTKPAES